MLTGWNGNVFFTFAAFASFTSIIARKISTYPWFS